MALRTAAGQRSPRYSSLNRREKGVGALLFEFSGRMDANCRAGPKSRSGAGTRRAKNRSIRTGPTVVLLCSRMNVAAGVGLLGALREGRSMTGFRRDEASRGDGLLRYHTPARRMPNHNNPSVGPEVIDRNATPCSQAGQYEIAPSIRVSDTPGPRGSLAQHRLDFQVGRTPLLRGNEQEACRERQLLLPRHDGAGSRPGMA